MVLEVSLQKGYNQIIKLLPMCGWKIKNKQRSYIEFE